jgi:hypothetical protein
MKKLILSTLLIIFSCGTQKNIPAPKTGESFYAESIKDGEDIMNMMRWKLTSVDTLKEKDGRKVYLFHYKDLTKK